MKKEQPAIITSPKEIESFHLKPEDEAIEEEPILSLIEDAILIMPEILEIKTDELDTKYAIIRLGGKIVYSTSDPGQVLEFENTKNRKTIVTEVNPNTIIAKLKEALGQDGGIE